MKKKLARLFVLLFALFFWTGMACAQPMLEVIKSFEPKEREAAQQAAVAEAKLTAETPALEQERDRWAQKANDIWLNHGQRQHEENSSAFNYWKGEWQKATDQKNDYERRMTELRRVYDSLAEEKNKITAEKEEKIHAYLDSLERTKASGPCQQELEKAKATISTVTSSALESLAHCWSVIFDNTRMDLRRIEGFVRMPSAFGDANVVALTAEDEKAAEDKREKMKEEIKKLKLPPKKPVVIPPLPPNQVPQQQPKPSLSDRTKALIDHLKNMLP